MKKLELFANSYYKYTQIRLALIMNSTSHTGSITLARYCYATSIDHFRYTIPRTYFFPSFLMLLLTGIGEVRIVFSAEASSAKPSSAYAGSAARLTCLEQGAAEYDPE